MPGVGGLLMNPCTAAVEPWLGDEISHSKKVAVMSAKRLQNCLVGNAEGCCVSWPERYASTGQVAGCWGQSARTAQPRRIPFSLELPKDPSAPRIWAFVRQGQGHGGFRGV